MTRDCYLSAHVPRSDPRAAYFSQQTGQIGYSYLSFLYWPSACIVAALMECLTFITLIVCVQTMENQRVFFKLWNHHKCPIQLFPVHLNTYVTMVMGYAHYKYFNSFSAGTVFMTYKDGPRTERVKFHYVVLSADYHGYIELCITLL